MLSRLRDINQKELTATKLTSFEMQKQYTNIDLNIIFIASKVKTCKP